MSEAKTHVKRKQKKNRRQGNNSNSYSHPSRHKPPAIVTSDFQSVFHKQCMAARYKVYAPMSIAAKASDLRRRYEASVQNRPKSPPIAPDSKEATADVMGELDRLTLNSRTHEIDDSTDGRLFDNLIVIPDVKSPRAVYVCTGTNLHAFVRGPDSIRCEKKLAREIFGHQRESQDRVVQPFDGTIPFKVSCAQCLLTSNYPNGFVAVLGDTAEELQPTIARARIAADAKRKKSQFHSDHADFVCAICLSTLQLLNRAGNTRSASSQLHVDLMSQLSNCGVQLSETRGDDVHNLQVKLGHHLTSILRMIGKDHDDKYVMILGYQKYPMKLELDIPGGKRHLGETTLDGAVRETEEECSLRIDTEWLASRMPARFGGKHVNPSGEDTEVSVLEPTSRSDMGNVFLVIEKPKLVDE
ncbi:hypothetical protein THAOC_00457 [Thalassiosira oceanica]|uniref:Nudix hydrolase domain-containing protein n=1 Tax=Thalassiosira oceanica TaxID=159749 RepID=K3W4C4_THAOC|nr:hypothetical protein THAOC_00457 [Thalassiosira oceanica]|eukprot:EJK77694.1 hypothetical protein THAOC_00457 [Thalassiosira oceanica]